MRYKPEGYTSLSPYLVVDDAQEVLDFVKAVFGTDPLRVFRGDDGALVHAEVRIDDSVLMIGQSPGGPDAHLHVYVDDSVAVFARAIDAGGTVVDELRRRDDGDRRGGVRDTTGTTWWISSSA